MESKYTLLKQCQQKIARTANKGCVLGLNVETIMAVHIQASFLADVILPGSSFKLLPIAIEI